MSDFSEDEKAEIAGRYAVAMHLEANRKVGKLARVVTVIAVIVAIYASSYWPLVIGVLLCVAIYFYLINSCVRYVKQQTGMPEEIQAFFSRRYKSDAQFAREVDELHKTGANLARHL